MPCCASCAEVGPGGIELVSGNRSSSSDVTESESVELGGASRDFYSPSLGLFVSVYGVSGEDVPILDFPSSRVHDLVGLCQRNSVTPGSMLVGASVCLGHFCFLVA